MCQGLKFPKQADNPKLLRDLVSGKKLLTDHNGYRLSPKGTRYDTLAQMAISEKEMKRIETERLVKKGQLESI